MELPNKKEIREKGVADLEEIIAALKDKRDNEAWERCVRLGEKHLGITAARDVLSDGKLNHAFLDKIGKVIQHIEDNNLNEGENMSRKILKEISSIPAIHSKIIFLTYRVLAYFKKSEDITPDDLKRDFAEISNEIL